MKQYVILIALCTFYATHLFPSSYEPFANEEDDTDKRAMHVVQQNISVINPRCCPGTAFYEPFHYARLTPDRKKLFLCYGYLATEDKGIDLKEEKKYLATFLLDTNYFDQKAAKEGITHYLQEEAYPRRGGVVKANMVDHSLLLRNGNIKINIYDPRSSCSFTAPNYMKEFTDQIKPELSSVPAKEKAQQLALRLGAFEKEGQHESIVMLLNLKQLKKDIATQKLLIDDPKPLDL